MENQTTRGAILCEKHADQFHAGSLIAINAKDEDWNVCEEMANELKTLGWKIIR